MASNTALRLLRQVHLYLGLFIAPALLFFAFTGAVQTLSLHEAAGDAYKAPQWLAQLGQLHKKQTLQFPPRRPGPPTARPGEHADAPRPAAPGRSGPPVTLQSKIAQHLPLKIFFVAVSLSLFTSTLTGIYMAYRYQRGKILVSALLLAGIVIPLILLRF